MDAAKFSSLLAILLVAVINHADAAGTIEYFNVSSTRLHESDTIVFTCVGRLEQTQDGGHHSLIMQIRKWFPGSRRQWLLSSNEDVEISSDRHHAKLHRNRTEHTQEVELKITNAMVEDSGNYTCEAGRNNVTVYVDVIWEPSNAVLLLNSTLVSKVDTNPAYAHDNRKDEQVEVQLERSYPVNCVVQGGNPPPAVTLSSGMMPYEGVSVTQKTERDGIDRMSEPLHTVNASLTWTPTIQNIGMTFNCMSGVDNPTAVWTSFVPVVADRQPLFDCVDEVALKDGDNDLTVTCRIVSTHTPLNSTKVRVFTADKEFTVEAELPSLPTDYPYSEDERYVVRVEPKPITYSWNVSLIIRDARTVENLDSHKLEFVAENQFDTTEHAVDVKADIDTSTDPSSTSRMTISMAAVLFAMVLGAFWRP